MHKIPIDGDGFIENPFASNAPELINKKSWGGIVYRRGNKIKIASFLSAEGSGKRINIRGVSKGLYLAFGQVGSKERLIYRVEEVAKSDFLLQCVDATSVPSMYDIDSTAPLKIYVLEARQAMLADQMNSLQIDMAIFKEAFAANIA
jgi:hypothetical protein